MNPLNHFGIRTRMIRGDTKSYNNSDFENEFEREKHADDNLHCKGCGKKIRYTGGWSDYCSDCRKGSGISRRSFNGHEVDERGADD